MSQVPARRGGDAHGPASPFQSRQWLLAQLGEPGATRHHSLTIRLRGDLDETALRTALAALSDRHEILRTRFHRLAWGEVVQAVDPAVVCGFNIEDISGLGPPDRERRVTEQTEADATTPFDLSRPPMLRARLLRLDRHEHMLLVTVHPIIADGWSLSLLASDMLVLYAAALGREGEAPMPPPAQYADYAVWQQERLKSGGFEDVIAGWRARLDPPHAPLDLPTDRPREAMRSNRSEQVRIDLDAALSTAMRAGALRHGLSPRQLAIAAFAVLLHRCTGQSDIRLGFSVANRSRAATVGTIGPFATLRILRLQLTRTTRLIDVLGQLAQAIHDAQSSDDLPFEWLAEALQPDRTANHAPLFQVLADCRQDPPVPVRIGGLEIESICHPAPLHPADLALNTEEDEGGQIRIGLRYASDLFRRATAERWAAQITTILRAMLAEPNGTVGAVPLVNAQELARLSAPWPSETPFDPAPIHRLIERQAERRPDAPAVIFGDRVMSFGTLDRRANRLAQHLSWLGVGPERRVGVAMERSPEIIVALLAVLKAGGAFLPIDPEHPAERIAYMLGDARVSLLLTESHLRERLPNPPEMEVVTLDRLCLEGMEDTPPALETHPQQLAYVIYTSGSTGQPKGVEVAHGALTIHCQATGTLYNMTEQSRELHFLSMSFDGAHERWMVPLSCGGSIVLRGPVLWSAAETYDALRDQAVTNAGFPPSYLNQLAQWAEQVGAPPPVRLYSFGGEAMPRATFALVKRALRPDWLINGYGPTEAVISPMVWKVAADGGFEGPYAPIGRAVGDRRAYILDADLMPVPVGVTGELYLGGAGLARGYLGRPAATAERFLPDPFSNDGGRLYRTGDLARWREDGTVEFLGRSDHQVKLRGYRVELGEIEARLSAHETVAGAVVVLRTDPGGARLLGYVVPAHSATPDPAALRAALAGSLPGYMVPSAITVLDAFPLTPNSKIDRNALPVPAAESRPTVPPRTTLESRLVELWANSLRVGTIGIDDDFFDLGGDSLTALEIVAQLRRLFPDRNITVVSLFNNRTIRQLAAALDRDQAGFQPVVHLRNTGSQPMLYCFPGLLVSTREYGPLVEHLGADQPATGFVCHSLSDGEDGFIDVETLAGRYAEHIRTHSASASCVLLGWSWGGILAYEAARQLRDEVDIRFVGMLDVCALDAEFAPDAEAFLTEADRARLQADIATWLDRSAMRAEWERLIARMDAKSYIQFLRYVDKSELGLPTDGPDVGSREHIFWTLMENALTFRSYRLQPFDCPIRAWVAEDSLNRGLNVIDWRQYSRRVEQVEILRDTTHLHIVRSEAFHRSFAKSLATPAAGETAKRQHSG